MKASNVYNVSPEELDYMIEQGLLRPAFKDEFTIFEDSFNNMFLLWKIMYNRIEGKIWKILQTYQLDILEV